jgi:hypothetical protein
MARRRLVTGLGSGIIVIISFGGRFAVGSTTGGIGSGGGSASVTECFLRRKKLDVFLVSVCVGRIAEWCDSREGGVERCCERFRMGVSTGVEARKGEADG